MNVEIVNQGGEIDLSLLDDLERLIGGRLPESYKSFLGKFNGGSPKKDGVLVPNFVESPTDLQIFFGVNRGIESSNLAWNIDVYDEFVKSGYLPIACDSGGNLFCLSFSNDSYGEVCYVDLIDESMEQYPIAKDFDEFLNALVE